MRLSSLPSIATVRGVEALSKKPLTAAEVADKIGMLPQQLGAALSKASIKGWCNKSFREDGKAVYTKGTQPLPKKSHTERYAVYIIGVEEDRKRFKIGVSCDPHRRAEEIKLHGGFAVVTVVAVEWFYERKNALALERSLHHSWRAYNIVGEWFRYEAS